MKGIDIASHQANIDFRKVKNSGIEIVYIKATEGVAYNSPLMKSQYYAAKAVGLKIGFYHYLRSYDPILEAKHFLSVIDGLSSDCKYVIGIEVALEQTIAQISSNLRQFADYLISNGKEICIYTGDSFYLNNLNDSVRNIHLWVAHYGVSEPDAINYIGFQHSNSGDVDGIKGFVDLDEFSSDIFIKPVNDTVPDDDHIVQLIDESEDKIVLDDNIEADNNENIVEVISEDVAVPEEDIVNTLKDDDHIVQLIDESEDKILLDDNIEADNNENIVEVEVVSETDPVLEEDIVNTLKDDDHIVQLIDESENKIILDDNIEADSNEDIVETVSENVSVPINLIVKTFQHALNISSFPSSNNDLVLDGIKGPNTMQAISKILVTRNISGALVYWIQQRLITLGFSCGETGANSEFGWSTLVAVQHYQASKDIHPDGIVGPLTITQLLKQ